jgi:hypothetical protein
MTYRDLLSHPVKTVYLKCPWECILLNGRIVIQGQGKGIHAHPLPSLSLSSIVTFDKTCPAGEVPHTLRRKEHTSGRGFPVKT